MDEKGGYILSNAEFVNILSAIQDIPKIYGQMTKIEQHIEKMSLRQDEKIEKMGVQISDLNYEIKDLNKRIDNSPYVESSKKIKYDEGLSRDLINIIVKGLTVLGTFGTIVYALIQSLGN